MSLRSIEGVLFREMTAGDLPQADHLRQLAGWNQTGADWRRLLALEPRGCFAAEERGRIIGSVTTTTHGPALAWIGMMLVHPEERGRGIGAGLMRAALARLEGAGVRSVKLDATPLGRPLYEKLGFVPEGALQRCRRGDGDGERGGGAASFREEARPLNGADWPAVENLDAGAFGASRSALLRGLAEGARAVLVWPATGAITGYGMLRPGDRASYLGPGVCGSPEGAAALAAVLLGEAGGGPVFWDVLDQCGRAKEAARWFGFVPERPLTRMRRGPEFTAGDLSKQFAIADPAVG